MATRTQKILKSVGKELKLKEPEIVKKTRERLGPKRAMSQKIAILLSKSRKRGARIPKP